MELDLPLNYTNKGNNMNLEDIQTSDNIPTQIYCDLDGVEVNFHKFAKDHIGIDLDTAQTDKKLKGQFWSRVDRLVKDGKPFFGAMEPMPDAFVLWDYIKKYDPIILSATGHTKGAENEKREWVRKYLGDHFADTAIFVKSAADKAQYATPFAVLIDDRKKAIYPWVEAGGIGVHHISAEDSITQLGELGL
jgi:hypothetical protein